MLGHKFSSLLRYDPILQKNYVSRFLFSFRVLELMSFVFFFFFFFVVGGGGGFKFIISCISKNSGQDSYYE